MNNRDLLVKKNELSLALADFIFLVIRDFKNMVAFVAMYAFGISIKRRENHKPNEKERFLFVHASLPLGDFLSRAMFIKNLELLTSEYSIDVCVDSRYESLVVALGLKANFLFINSLRFKLSPIYRLSIHRKIKNNNYDNVVNISVDRGMVSDELSILSGGKRIVTIKKNNKYLCDRIEKIFNRRYDSIIELYEKNEYLKMEKLFQVLFNERKYITSPIKLDLPLKVPYSEYVSINITASSKIKMWPVANQKALINMLKISENIVLLGKKTNRKHTKLSLQGSDRVLDLTGKTQFEELPSIIMKSKLFIGNDSGLLHLAFVLGVRSIGVIGGGAFDVFFPHHFTKNQRYLYHELDCFNCGWRCKYKESYCVSKVSVLEVYKITQSFLKN